MSTGDTLAALTGSQLLFILYLTLLLVGGVGAFIYGMISIVRHSRGRRLGPPVEHIEGAPDERSSYLRDSWRALTFRIRSLRGTRYLPYRKPSMIDRKSFLVFGKRWRHLGHRTYRKPPRRRTYVLPSTASVGACSHSGSEPDLVLEIVESAQVPSGRAGSLTILVMTAGSVDFDAVKITLVRNDGSSVSEAVARFDPSGATSADLGQLKATAVVPVEFTCSTAAVGDDVRFAVTCRAAEESWSYVCSPRWVA